MPLFRTLKPTKPPDIGQLAAKRNIRGLIEALKYNDPYIRAAAAQAIGQLGSVKNVPTLIAALKDSHPHARAAVAQAIGQLGSVKNVPTLIAALKNSDPYVRAGAALALGQLGDEQATKPLIAAIADSESIVSAAVAKAIGQIELAQAAKHSKLPPKENEATTIIHKGMASARGEVQKAAKLHVNSASPNNQSVFDYLHISKPDQVTLDYPDAARMMELGTHPDLVYYLWGLAPESARVINYPSRPVLVHSTSGIVFGLALGTLTLAVRLPEPQRSQMITRSWFNDTCSGASLVFPETSERPATTLYAKDIGEDWVFLETFEDAKTNKEMCQIAYSYAETLT